MGLLGKKEMCAICGGKLSLLTKVKLADGSLCGSCRNKCTQFLQLPYTRSAIEIKENMNEAEDNRQLYSIFRPQDIGVFYADFQNKLWCVATKRQLKAQQAYIFRFSEIMDYSFIEDGRTIQKSGTGAAVAGGLLFGGIGLVAGGLAGRKSKEVIKRLSIIVNTSNKWAGNVELNIIDQETKKGGINYRLSMQITENTVAALNRIMQETKQMG